MREVDWFWVFMFSLRVASAVVFAALLLLVLAFES
jgi:hypothetical protein